MSITLTLDRTGFDLATRLLLEEVEDFGDVSDVIAKSLEESVRRNFDVGGRPTKWKPSKRAIGQAGYGEKSGQTLVDNETLLDSIVGEGFAQQVKVGTNVDYAAAHNFGVDKLITQQVRTHTRHITQAFGKEIDRKKVTVKAHSRKMHLKLPQREFMMIQDEDWEDIEDVITIRLQQLVGRK